MCLATLQHQSATVARKGGSVLVTASAKLAAISPPIFEHHCIRGSAPIPCGRMRLCVPEFAITMRHVRISSLLKAVAIRAQELD